MSRRPFRHLPRALALAAVASAGAFPCPAAAFEPEEVRSILWNPPDPQDHPGWPGVIAAHQTHHVFLGNGNGTVEEHLFVAVFDPAAEHPLVHRWETEVDRRLQFLQVLAARRHRGEEALDLGQDDWDESPIPGASPEAYPARRRFTVRYPDLQPGDVMEIHVRVTIQTDPTRVPVLWGVEPLTSSLPVVERQILLTAPTAMAFVNVVIGWPAHVLKYYKGEVIHHDLHTGHLPAWPAGAGTCGDETGPPRFVYSSAASWERTGYIIGREYEWALSTATLEIGEKARDLTKGMATSREKLNALLEYMTSQIGSAPEPSPLLSYWPRPATESFESGWVDRYDWIALLGAMTFRVGLPAEIRFVAPRQAWVDPDVPALAQLTNPTLKVHLPDEGRDVWIDPRRAPAGISVRPFPGAITTLLPQGRDADIDSFPPLTAAETRFVVDLDIRETNGLLSGDGRSEGTGLGASWALRRNDDSGAPPLVGSWLPIDAPVTTEEWLTSSASATFRWQEAAGSPNDDRTARLAALLPPLRGGAAPGDTTGICPEGPLTLTTTIRFPEDWTAGPGPAAWDGAFACGSWRIARSQGAGGRTVLEETVVWETTEGCRADLGDLARARSAALGLP